MKCPSAYQEGSNFFRCVLKAGHPGDTHAFSAEWQTSQQYVPPPPPPTIEEQFERVKTKFPDAELVKRDFGFIVKFTLPLPKGRYNRDSTWVAFDVPPGFPAAHPSNFYTDKDLRFESGGWLNRADRYFNHPKLGDCTIVFGNVQAWNPNHCTLFTYAMVIKHALETLDWRKPEDEDEDES